MVTSVKDVVKCSPINITETSISNTHGVSTRGTGSSRVTSVQGRSSNVRYMLYCRSGRIREVLILANISKRTKNPTIRNSRKFKHAKINRSTVSDFVC